MRGLHPALGSLQPTYINGPKHVAKIMCMCRITGNTWYVSQHKHWLTVYHVNHLLLVHHRLRLNTIRELKQYRARMNFSFVVPITYTGMAVSMCSNKTQGSTPAWKKIFLSVSQTVLKYMFSHVTDFSDVQEKNAEGWSEKEKYWRSGTNNLLWLNG